MGGTAKMRAGVPACIGSGDRDMLGCAYAH